MADTAVAEAAPLTLREHIAAETPPVVAPVVTPVAEPTPVVADAVAPAVPEAEAEADSTKPDADLSAAGRALRANRLDTRKAKLRTEITELNELMRQRKELREQIAAVTPPAVADPRTAIPAIDPRDPEPTFDSFVAANPTHPDPYAGTERAWNQWDRRREQKAAEQSRYAQQAEHASREAVTSYQTRAAELKATHSDYDAVTAPILDTYANHPYSTAVASFLGSDPLGPQVLYHLAKHPDAERDLFAPTSNPLVVLGEIRATVKASLTPKTTPVTSAPSPPSRTVGSGASVTPDTRNLADHIRVEEAEIAERRRRGYRY